MPTLLRHVGGSSRSAKYERKEEDVDELEKLATKLTEDLHKRLHLFTACPVLSKEWVLMSELCGRIAHITEVEAKLDKKEGTMWEGEELALRYLMEDGKLNVCLRNLVEYRSFSRTRIAEADPVEIKALENFEKGMGILLRNAWQHVEAIQTTDLPLLVGYCAQVLGDAVDDDAWARPRVVDACDSGDLPFRQETMVLHYVRGLCACVDEISQLGFMALCKKHTLVEKVVRFLDLHAPRLRMMDLFVAAQALSDIVDTDDFQTYEDAHATPAVTQALANFRPLFLDEFTQDYQTRKTIQPLLRYIQDITYK